METLRKFTRQTHEKPKPRRGSERDANKAKSWFEKSATQGNQKAAAALKSL